MVLNAGIQNAKDLLRGDSEGKKYLKIVLGTGNAPVTGNETSLTNQVEKDVLTVNDLANGYLQLNGELDGSDPSMIIQEMGILNEDGVLCHRKVITPQNIVSGVVYSIGYKIRVQ